MTTLVAETAAQVAVSLPSIFKWLKSLVASSLFNTVINLLIGGAISYYFFQKQQAKRSIRYSVGQVSLVQSEGVLPSVFKITCNELPIPNLVKTTIAIWNSGNDGLIDSNFAEERPFKVVFIGTRILHIRLARKSTGASDVEIEQPQGSDHFYLSLAHLNRKAGFVLEVYHAEAEPEIVVECPLVNGDDFPIRSDGPKGIFQIGASKDASTGLYISKRTRGVHLLWALFLLAMPILAIADVYETLHIGWEKYLLWLMISLTTVLCAYMVIELAKDYARGIAETPPFDFK